jgi:hypothetical protein
LFRLLCSQARGRDKWLVVQVSKVSTIVEPSLQMISCDDWLEQHQAPFGAPKGNTADATKV